MEHLGSRAIRRDHRSGITEKATLAYERSQVIASRPQCHQAEIKRRCEKLFRRQGQERQHLVRQGKVRPQGFRTANQCADKARQS